MRLATFIHSNREQIISQWESFAQTLMPAADDMSPLALRNHITDILTFVADDIESSQTVSEQKNKSLGKKFKETKDSAAETHAALREAGGFSLDQMISEFRALRASVTHLWTEQLTEVTKLDMAALTRFNEAIDQVLTESVAYYSKKLDHSRDMFLGILGHDLRNPLGAILMSAQLTSKIGTLNEHQAMLNSQIVASSGRATEILDHLLDLTRARLGSGIPVIREHMDMAFLSRQLVDEMRAMHPGRTFTLEISGDTEGEWDKPRIGQVFSNLLGNAVQYGFTDLPIAVTIKGDSEEVLLSVHNGGVPISSDKMGRIFDSLTRGEVKNGAQPRSINLGLGLFIVKEIVSAHGGQVSATSSEKDGTTFTAHFPRSPRSIAFATANVQSPALCPDGNVPVTAASVSLTSS
jgi:signal transduction histidine kinase